MREKNDNLIMKELQEEMDDEKETKAPPKSKQSSKKFQDSMVPEGELLGKGMRKHKKKNKVEGRFAIQAEI